MVVWQGLNVKNVQACTANGLICQGGDKGFFVDDFGTRPKIVDEEPFIAALTNQSIGGAGLDVFNIEPLPDDHPFRLLPNVISTPHIGFVTKENYQIFYQESLENLKAFVDGKPIRVVSAAEPFLPDSQVASQMHRQGGKASTA